MKSFNISSKADEKALNEFLDEVAVTATPFENQVISTILNVKNPIQWKFEKNQICPSCHRHLTILDYFLSGILHHPISYIRNEVCFDKADTLLCEADVAPDRIAKVDIVDSPIKITCTNCGNVKESFTYPLYLHPGCKGATLRMSSVHYEAFKAYQSKGKQSKKARKAG